MSYCRWSSDLFRCDLYAYGGPDEWSIHVASRRYVFAEPLTLDVDAHGLTTTEWLDRHREVMQKVRAAPMELINLPHAGESLYFATYGEFVAKMVELVALGYRVPDGLIKDLRENVADDGESERC